MQEWYLGWEKVSCLVYRGSSVLFKLLQTDYACIQPPAPVGPYVKVICLCVW